jgi:hypothetical protein
MKRASVPEWHITGEGNQCCWACQRGPETRDAEKTFSKRKALIALTITRHTNICRLIPAKYASLHCSADVLGIPHALLEVVDFSTLGFGNYKYDVLSYSWCREDPIHPIIIQYVSSLTGASQNAKTLFIRPNLYHALRRLREKSGVSINLWIDAICIDQLSAKEKTHQLPKMIHIYNRAANTCIWIGEPSTGGIETERGMIFIEDIVDIDLLDTLVRVQSTLRTG